MTFKNAFYHMLKNITTPKKLLFANIQKWLKHQSYLVKI